VNARGHFGAPGAQGITHPTHQREHATVEGYDYRTAQGQTPPSAGRLGEKNEIDDAG
jgi:hypothetical protein